MSEFAPINLSMVSHSLEIYTARYFVQGTVAGPYRRASDLLNSREGAFLAVGEASLSSVGQAAKPQQLDTPLMVSRSGIHFVALAPSRVETEGMGELAERPEFKREGFVAKETYSCYALTDNFVIRGRCHLREGVGLQQLLDMSDAFVPITGADIHLVTRPDARWQRDAVFTIDA